MPEVRTIAVIGAGPLGRNIASLAALAGYRTILEDILPSSLRNAEDELRNNLGRIAGRKETSKEAAAAALVRLEYASTVEEAARQADLVIEAVPDELESKLEIFTLLDKICRPHTILVSSTAAFSITEIAGVTYRPGKCAAMRSSPPLQAMKTLEVVCGRETDKETKVACGEVVRRMGMKAKIMNE